ncbi:hypothetical protein EYF80_007088 [Liparis tanakae]|uniref:Uncharacterized protein n=1 Tax=Liparis tanakae TaxID=230148 RepID=A0A4Z2IX68_9TELE|nr:hypothetical protein EYF80_007088 [Liparis tanakae]
MGAGSSPALSTTNKKLTAGKTSSLDSVVGSVLSSTTQPLHGAQSTPSVILHKPPEAQDLDQNRGNQNEEQGQA